MCKYLSFVLTDDERVLRGIDLDAHYGIENLHNLKPGTYRECEWTNDDDGESLTVRVSEDDERKGLNSNWFRSLILSKFNTRKELEEHIITSLNGKYVSKSSKTYWFKNGKIHRSNGPALITYAGTKLWYKNGEVHRNNGPAVIYPDGTKEWYKDGKLHREDGPAIECKDGEEWWSNGVRFTPDSMIY